MSADLTDPGYNKLAKPITVGEDGEVIMMYGHGDRRLTFAAMVVAYAELIGVYDTLYVMGWEAECETISLSPDDVRLIWVTNDPDANDGEGWIEWGSVNQHTPGAIPVSILDLDR